MVCPIPQGDHNYLAIDTKKTAMLNISKQMGGIDTGRDTMRYQAHNGSSLCWQTDASAQEPLGC